MATIKTGNGNGKYHDPSALHDVITYVLNSWKAPNYFGGYRVNPITPIDDMQRVIEQFGKSNGVQLRHFIISFSGGFCKVCRHGKNCFGKRKGSRCCAAARNGWLTDSDREDRG